jgi:hypothetical protein
MRSILLGLTLAAALLSAATLTVVPSTTTTTGGETILVDINVGDVTDLYGFS